MTAFIAIQYRPIWHEKKRRKQSTAQKAGKWVFISHIFHLHIFKHSLRKKIASQKGMTKNEMCQQKRSDFQNIIKSISVGRERKSEKKIIHFGRKCSNLFKLYKSHQKW